MLLSLFYVSAGFVLLMLSAEYTVRGAVSVAVRLRIPTLIIGLTIVAFGTSAPEFVVSISAALKGSPGIAIGNVVGSNIANLLLILGFAAIINPVSSVRKIFLRDYFFLFLVTALFALFALSKTFVFWHGVVMLILLAVFIVYNYRNTKKNKNMEETEDKLADKNWTFVILLTLGGLCGIIFGADLLVKGAVMLARLLGASEEVIGLTIIAFGTSLPELATTGMAAFRRQNDVALGNIIGSNIWNIVFIMGATAAVTDVPVPAQFLRYDIWVLLGATLLFLPLMLTKSKLSRFEGSLFVILYLMYLASQVLITRGYPVHI